MAPRWTFSSRKHGIPREDQVHVLLNPDYTREIEEEKPARGRVMLFIGHPHSQTSREVEILVHEYPDSEDEAVVFHAMPLGPKYRRYRQEHPDE